MVLLQLQLQRVAFSDISTRTGVVSCSLALMKHLHVTVLFKWPMSRRYVGRIALCSQWQAQINTKQTRCHSVDGVPPLETFSEPDELACGSTKKNASASISRTTWIMVSNRLTHSNTSPHLGQPFFQKQFVTPRYFKAAGQTTTPLAWHLPVKVCGTRKLNAV